MPSNETRPQSMETKQSVSPAKKPVIHYREDTSPIACPYGRVQRVVTGGEGGVANVHVVTVTAGGRHYHRDYDEVYYVLSGTGKISLNGEEHQLRPGAVIVIPAGLPHALQAAPGENLEFVIFGTPPVAIDDERATPRSS